MVSALALSACDRPAAQVAEGGPAFSTLKAAAAFPIGAAVQAAQLDDPALAALIGDNVSQLTAEWEMKMEYILRDDGDLRFDAPDRIADFARSREMALFGHTLVWYAQSPRAFERLAGRRAAFARAYGAYIGAVVARYRGLARGWDVVNEAVAEDGNGLRSSLWSRELGEIEHMTLAFAHARQADPGAVLFLNDYNLEHLPAKRRTFLALAERLLKAGAPLGGLGTQSHISADLAPGAFKAALADLAALGLPVHVSEMDVSLARARGAIKLRSDLEARQTALYVEAAEAFADLPPGQRFAFTHWGLRDRDSWLRREDAADAPLLFDDAGRPKPAASAWARAIAGA